MFRNIFNEMASRARHSTRRVRKSSLALIYLFVCINQGHGLELASIYNSADHYWPLRNVSDNTSLDVVGLAHASVLNGAKWNESNRFGLALMLDGLDDCITIDLLSEDCTNRPSTCHYGFTVTFWLYYIRGEFLLCAGAYTNENKGPGIKYTFDEAKKLFIIEVSTLDLTWRVTTHMVRRKWVHVAFTWSSDKGIKLFLNGSNKTKQQSERTIIRFVAPETGKGWSLGKPNEILKLINYGSFGISHLALWRRELTPTEIKTAYLETIIQDPFEIVKVVLEDSQPTPTNSTIEEPELRQGTSEAIQQHVFASLSWTVALLSIYTLIHF